MIKQIEASLISGNYSPEPVPYDESTLDGYCPAPLLLLGPESNQGLIERQDALISHLVPLTYHEVIRQGAKDGVALFAARSVYVRMRKREALNSISYINRKSRNIDFSKIKDESEFDSIVACEKAKYGGATATQSHLARRAFAMESIELANLTTLGRARSQLIEPMWQDINQLVSSKNGSEVEKDHYKLNVLNFDRNPRNAQHLGAVRIDAKRKISQIDTPDEVSGSAIIKARTTAIINTRPSDGLDKDYVKELIKAGKNAAESTDDLNIEVSDELKQVLSQLLLTNSDLVIARNDTIYEAPVKNPQ